MTILLRPMIEADVETVLPIERELFAGDPPWTPGIFGSELREVPATRWYSVALDGDDVVGYAGLMFAGLPGDAATITTIAVDVSRQRQGVGSLLMTALLDEAVRRRAGDLLLEVRDDNSAALEFYATFGFEQVSVRPAYYGRGRDGLVLRRTL